MPSDCIGTISGKPALLNRHYIGTYTAVGWVKFEVPEECFMPLFQGFFFFFSRVTIQPAGRVRQFSKSRGLGWVGSGRVGSGRVGLGLVGSGQEVVGLSRDGSDHHASTRPASSDLTREQPCFLSAARTMLL